MARASFVATAGLALLVGCGSSKGTATDGGAGGSACVPTVPAIAWTSPYAGWSRGIPTDPAFFPISAWLQGSWHATEMAALGINIYVGNNAGTDALAAARSRDAEGAGYLRHRRAGHGGARQHRRSDDRRLVDDAGRA